MLSPETFVAAATDLGFGPWTGVPCSFLKPFINHVMASPTLEYLAANNEGEAVALATGAWLAGRRPIVMFQNSGLGNAVNPLTSLVWTFGVPLLLIVTWRGEPGRPDEPQHELMGQITPALLDLMQIPHETFPESDEAIGPALERARDGVYAFVMREGSVRSGGDAPAMQVTPHHGELMAPQDASDPLPSRAEMLTAVTQEVGPETLLIATTGKTGRELFTIEDRPTNFYVVGSMGCASSIGMGLARYQPQRRVVVLDGDGAALMRLEAMAGIGCHGTANLTHCLLDNQAHESTGGQPTLSPGVDFLHIALACGYRSVVQVGTPQGLVAELQRTGQTPGPHLVHARIRPGSMPDLGRPTVSPRQVAERFRQALLAHR